MTMTSGGYFNVPSEAQVGETIPIASAVWSPAATSVQYQWYRDREPIAGATSSTYTMTADDQGQDFSFTETGTVAGYQPYTYTYPSYLYVAGAATLGTIGVITPPQIVGVPQVGKPLQITPGEFDTPDVDVWYDILGQDGQHWVDADDPAGYVPTDNEVEEDLGLQFYVYKTGYTIYRSEITWLSTPTLPDVFSCGQTHDWQNQTIVGNTVSTLVACNAQPDEMVYQWRADGVDIPGATSKSIYLTQDMLGEILSVVVTSTRADIAPYTDTEIATEITPVGDGFPVTPTPTITGATTYGSTLTAHPGDWEVPGTTFEYEWFVGNAAQPWSNTGTFLLGADTVGQEISVQVSASAPTYFPGFSSKSLLTNVVGIDTMTITGVKLSGHAALNDTLTAVVTSTVGNDAAAYYSYQWNSNGVAIPGATSSNYSPQPADYGKTVSVTVTGVAGDFTSNTMTSAGVKVVEGYLNWAIPVIAGTPVVGSTLRDNPIVPWGPGPVHIYYYWYEDVDGSQWKLLSHASTYTPPASMLGHELQLWESASESHFYPVGTAWVGSQIVVVGRGTITDGSEPVVVGLPEVGSALAASHGIVSPGSGVTYHYQWYSAGTATGTQTAIRGANSSTYVPVATMVGRFLFVRVTVSAAGYATASFFSPPIPPVLTAAADRVAHPPARSGSTLSPGD